MSSSAVMESDEDYARRLQEEEMRQVVIRPSSLPRDSLPSSTSQQSANYDPAPIHDPHSQIDPHEPIPSLDRSGAGQSVNAIHRLPGLSQPQSRLVHQNAVADLTPAPETSPRILAFYVFLAIGELITSIIILSLTWNTPCDKNLKWFVLFYSARWVVVLPLTLKRAVTGVRTLRENQLKNWVELAAFILWIVAQFWVYNSSTCSSTNYTLFAYTIVLISLFYVGLLLPLLLVLMICLCLPLALVVARYLAPNQGATQNAIEKLPKRIWHPQEETKEDEQEAPAAAAAAAAASSSSSNSGRTVSTECPICMEEYVDGVELRVLPCEPFSHEFHVACIDKWLVINRNCPLCRHPIIKEPGRESEAVEAGAASGAEELV